MSVTAEMVVTIAEVEVTDGYTIDLHVPEARKKHLILTADEAEQLGNELIDAAIAARQALREDIEARGIAQISHAFDAVRADLRPVHPECAAGKCGNCDGETLNSRDQMVPCTHGCHGPRAS